MREGPESSSHFEMCVHSVCRKIHHSIREGFSEPRQTEVVENTSPRTMMVRLRCVPQGWVRDLVSCTSCGKPRIISCANRYLTRFFTVDKEIERQRSHREVQWMSCIYQPTHAGPRVTSGWPARWSLQLCTQPQSIKSEPLTSPTRVQGHTSCLLLLMIWAGTGSCAGMLSSS